MFDPINDQLRMYNILQEYWMALMFPHKEKEPDPIELQKLIAKAIVHQNASPIPMTYNEVWEQTSEKKREKALNQAYWILHVLDVEKYRIVKNV